MIVIVFTFVIRYLNPMKERILEFLKAENRTSAQFAEQIGVQPSAVSHIISGRNNPSLDFVMKMFSKYPYLSVEWLLFGKGGMYTENQMQDLFDQANTDDRASGEIHVEKDFWVNSGDKELKNVPQQAEPSEYTAGRPVREVKRIVWFYDDNTFTEYLPS